MAALWAVGLLVEGTLVAVMFTLLVPPEPPLVARLRGGHSSPVQVVFARQDADSTDTSAQPAAPPAPVVGEDSFYTVLHWPLDRPLLQGGGHVVVLPMRMWWVPALYLGAVPLVLLAVTGSRLWARRRARVPGPPA